MMEVGEESPEPRRQRFPETLTRVLRMVDQNETKELAEHVMSVYWRPLCAYFMGSSLRGIRDLIDGGNLSEKAEDFVGGFFENRLRRDDYLKNWRESGKPLHKYLIGGLFLYRDEVIRQKTGRKSESLVHDPLASDAAIANELDRDRVRELVRRAAVLALEESREGPYEEHVRLFVTRQWNDMGQKTAAREFGVDVERAKRMYRTGKAHFARCLLRVLDLEGITNIDRAILEFKEIINS